ncbi:MAG: heme-binding protein [Planctomycetota bacterium]
MRAPATVCLLLAVIANSSDPASAQAPTSTDATATTSTVERLLQSSDLDARREARSALAEGLAADKARMEQSEPESNGSDENRPAQRWADLQVLASHVQDLLPDDSAADRRLAAAITTAKSLVRTEGAGAAAVKLRLLLADLDFDLVFSPVREADLPKGFPPFAAVDEIELRDYPAYRMVKAPMRKNGSMSAFWMLFNHIKKNDIAMTTPVQIDFESDGTAAQEASMAFLYGDPAIGEAAVAGKVDVVDVAAQTVLSLGARGYERQDRLEELHRRLQQFLAAHASEFEPAGTMRMLNYNSPSVGDDRRYFEVQLPVRRVVSKQTGDAELPREDK